MGWAGWETSGAYEGSDGLLVRQICQSLRAHYSQPPPALPLQATLLWYAQHIKQRERSGDSDPPPLLGRTTRIVIGIPQLCGANPHALALVGYHRCLELVYNTNGVDRLVEIAATANWR
jgi:hypothetical protein